MDVQATCNRRTEGHRQLPAELSSQRQGACLATSGAAPALEADRSPDSPMARPP